MLWLFEEWASSTLSISSSVNFMAWKTTRIRLICTVGSFVMKYDIKMFFRYSELTVFYRSRVSFSDFSLLSFIRL